MGSHSVSCYPTQVNALRLNPSQTGLYLLDLGVGYIVYFSARVHNFFGHLGLTGDRF